MSNSRSFSCTPGSSVQALLIWFSLYAFSTALAHAGADSSPPSPASPATEINTYVTIIGGVLTAVVTLLGLPIVRLNQRKTQAEIVKLELEAEALRNQGAITQPSQVGDGVRINIDNSPNSNVQILADPRFLAPLLLLVDFVFAWAILTLAGRVLDIFPFWLPQDLALAAIALYLFLPIAKQAFHIRAVMRSRTPDEIASAIRQIKYVAYAVYSIGVASIAAFTALIMTNELEPSDFVLRYLGWGTAILTLGLALSFPLVRRRLDRYIVREFGQVP